MRLMEAEVASCVDQVLLSVFLVGCIGDEVRAILFAKHIFTQKGRQDMDVPG